MKTQNIPASRLLVLFALGCFALSKPAQAVNPPPGGGYGGGNTAEGTNVLLSQTTGVANTANGAFALPSNTTGTDNTAIGENALHDNTTGYFNTANGVGTLFSNSAGFNNTAIGVSALSNNTGGSGNIAVGVDAGSNVIFASNVIAIGNPGQDANDGCFIGQTYTNIQPQVGTDPDLVTVNSSGRLGRANVSSRRYKHDIKPMNQASETIYALKPVSFRYHEQYDATQTVAFGLIAEEVAEVAPDLVGRDEKGEPESVRYEQINAMLLNEFLKEHTKVEEQNCKIQQQESTIAELQNGITTLIARIEEQDAKLQRVSAQMERNSASRMVVND